MVKTNYGKPSGEERYITYFSAVATDALTTCIQISSHGYTNYVHSMPEPQICQLRACTAAASDIRTTCIHCHSHGYKNYMH